jgi:hypothetical protein
MEIRKGQRWKSKGSGIIIDICCKTRGGKHWKVSSNRKRCHHLRESIICKHFILLKDYLSGE